MTMHGATVLITGGTGSLGNALIPPLKEKYGCRKIIVFSRDECKQQKMQREFGDSIPELRFLLGDVRDLDRLREVLKDVDFCVHAAALKHVDKCEYNPSEAVKTNVIGSMNVVRACMDCGVAGAVLVSTDKAVNPVNTYGATKLAAERMFLASNDYNKTRFCVTRYGNVIGSRGSVIETFLNLHSRGIHLFPITDIEMTRFWIELPDAANFVLQTLSDHCPGVNVPEMASMRITDVAYAIDPAASCDIVGMRPGEKLHECIVSPDERIPGYPKGLYSNTNTRWMSSEELREKLGLG